MDDRLVAIRNAVEYVYGARVEGDIIEFGVMSGYSASALINSVMEFCSVYRDASETKCVGSVECDRCECADDQVPYLVRGEEPRLQRRDPSG